MKETGLKNTVVLKNLQSNVIEEAIIVFKKNTKIPKLSTQKIEKIEKEYPLIEAERLINGYVEKLENNVDKKNKKYKLYIGICIFIIIVQNILIYIK